MFGELKASQAKDRDGRAPKRQGKKPSSIDGNSLDQTSQGIVQHHRDSGLEQVLIEIVLLLDLIVDPHPNLSSSLTIGTRSVSSLHVNPSTKLPSSGVTVVPNMANPVSVV